MPKVFNIILGAGFSHSIAGLPLASQLSQSIYESMSAQGGLDRRIVDDLRTINHRTGHSIGNSRHVLFQDMRFYEFYLSLMYKDLPDAYSSIDQYAEADTYQKRILKDIFYEDLRKEWNYETIVSELRALRQSLRYFPNCLSNQVKSENVQTVYDYFFRYIFDKVNNFTKINEEQKNNFRTFLKYLVDLGYTVQIFDLNHDSLLEKIIREERFLSGLYCNFFDEYLEDESFQNAIGKRTKKLNLVMNNQILHYKPHGSFEIIYHYAKHGFLKIDNLTSADWFQENEKYLVKSTLLFADTYKSIDTLRSDYHAFCYGKLIKSFSRNNPLLSIGYGRGDDHLNYAIELGYEVSLNDLDREVCIFAHFTDSVEMPLRETMFSVKPQVELYSSTIRLEAFLSGFINRLQSMESRIN